MVIKLKGSKYYHTAEACVLAGTNRNNFLRWVKNGTFPDVQYRDRNGWRLFTEQDIRRLEIKVNSIQDLGSAKHLEL